MSLISRLKLVFTYKGELDTIVEERRLNRIIKEQEAVKDNLKLCLKHKQEINHSIYSEDNCDYCKLLKMLKEKS